MELKGQINSGFRADTQSIYQIGMILLQIWLRLSDWEMRGLNLRKEETGGETLRRLTEKIENLHVREILKKMLSFHPEERGETLWHTQKLAEL